MNVDCLCCSVRETVYECCVFLQLLMQWQDLRSGFAYGTLAFLLWIDM